MSILLPVYNAEKFLAPALASLLMQDHSNLEIIAIDDGSTDRSARILRKAAEGDPRLRVLSRGNRGLIATLNEGLGMARADFIARMDADDIAYPGRISSQMRAFADDPTLALHGCNFDTIYAGNRMMPRTLPDATEPAELRVLSRFCTILRHPGVMFRRSAMPEGMLRYDEAYPCAEDFDLFRRIAACCTVRQGTEPQLAYRMHEGSVSATRVATMMQTHVRILEEELARHYPEAAGTGFGRIAEIVDADSVARAADLVRRLTMLADRQPADEAQGFRIGARNTFYLLFSMIGLTHDYRLASAFLDQSGQWAMIRRRERPLLGAAHLAPGAARLGYALHYGLLGLTRALRSRSVRRTVPGYGALAGFARDLTSFPRGVGHAEA
ncbi:glycosyltransferase family 2 protein [Cereibacter sediminicola]|uniref:glycosyltransferase family 2 protein n=1 Tax=Cereibacter sediminicola TaxID=2584941 RepID=UPI001642E997|nr:glycosyltransferase family 2 protein [Cereibacter sediminicola]